MTSVELAIRLVRDLDVENLTLLSSDGRLDLVTAINSALQRHHGLSPDHLKITQASVRLNAPETITIGVTNGSANFTGWTPTQDQLYASLRIDGDTNLDHRAVSETELLDEYLGLTGTQSATLYYDVVNFYQPIEAMASQPRLDVDGRFLTHNQDHPMWTGSDQNRKTIGRPHYYKIEKNAVNNGSEVMFSLRVDNLPDQDYRLRMDVRMAPTKIAFDDLVTPVDLPIRDDQVESVLLPIARNELTISELWKNKDKIGRVKERAEKAERFFANLSTKHTAPNYNKVGTPTAW